MYQLETKGRKHLENQKMQEHIQIKGRQIEDRCEFDR